MRLTHNRRKAIKACLFDMDGTLINSEDIYTACTNALLADFGKGPFTWEKKMKVQGRPGPEAARIIVEDFELPVKPEEFQQLAMKKQETLWKECGFLPGALELLKYLHGKRVPMALGTSSNSVNFDRKTSHLREGFDLFGKHIVKGDDERIGKDRGKPNPDIWFVCLESLNNDRLSQGLDPIAMDECLIFEDGIPGVKSAVAADSHVIWIPDENVIRLLQGEEKEIIGDNGEILPSLLHFDLAKYSL
ncbi:Piso0_001099 [Millerozyma farinosa CBS 7064]|uniref:Piso0_001099 protein n=1 Tax=Pichia sorbitophila (strain ATCC MYA-4447 / BCRC 22081 / CBS 7064 / NBRC 10061 / NRRL Y-12695) TaxID=559304 RepID=G8YSD9_PICSO|nr:Piso0_001099 [Millerozyma farinosa CBS 7064]CCE79062.1 Piso0_001099 [Millerozyma farinosa CBS 7064]